MLTAGAQLGELSQADLDRLLRSGVQLSDIARTTGQLTAEEYDDVVRDIVNFLDYLSEPMQLERQAIGIRVIAFLLVFLVLAYMLKKEVWKDVK